MARRLPKPDMNIRTTTASRAKGASIGIEYSLDPSAVILVAEFNKLGLDIRSFKEPLHRSVKIMGPSFQQNFTVSGRPTKWEPLADVTVTSKYSRGNPRPSAPLIATGLLQKTVGQQKIWKIDGLEGYAAVDDLGSAWYGTFHQSGLEGIEVGVVKGKIGRTSGTIEIKQMGGIPQREFLVFQPEDERRIEDIFIAWFAERAAMNGFRPARLRAGGLGLIPI